MKTMIRRTKNSKAQGAAKSPAKKDYNYSGQFTIQVAFLPEAFLKKTSKGTKVVPNPDAPQFL